MSNYTSIPGAINISDAINNEYRLSAKSYKRILITNPNCKSISDLLSDNPNAGDEVGSLAYIKKSEFLFIKTKSIQDINFTLDLETVGTFEFIKPADFQKNSKKKKEIKKHDILFVTGGNVGAVAIADKNYDNVVYSSHLSKINCVNQLYVFAFLKNQLGKEQANFAPEGAIKGLDTFKIEFLLNIKIPFPNSKKEATIRFVELITEAIINKELLIKKRHKSILELISNELLNNQRRNKFKFELPTIKEIESIGRLDTSRYSEQYKSFEHLIANYSFGSFKLSEKGYKVKRGQNLQVSNIGESYYSDIFIKGFYNLVVSSNFSEYSTVEKMTFLGNPNKLAEIMKGDIIFSARGAQFGRVIIYPESIENIITNIDSLVISNSEAPLYESIFVGMFLNNLRWNKHIYKIAITGSGANSLTSYQSDDINFPNFPEKIKKEISLLYHNSNATFKYEKYTLDNFLVLDDEMNKVAGIYELDKSVKYLKALLNKTLNNIANNKEVTLKFA